MFFFPSGMIFSGSPKSLVNYYNSIITYLFRQVKCFTEKYKNIFNIFQMFFYEKLPIILLSGPKMTKGHFRAADLRKPFGYSEIARSINAE